MTVTMFGCASRAAARAWQRFDVVVVARVLLVEDLDRDGSLEQPVVRPEDVRHAAGADELLQLVAARDDLTHHGLKFP